MHVATWQGEQLGAFANDEQARATEALAQRMSDVSERCFAAGWFHKLEYSLWEALERGPRDWGRDSITQDDIDRMRELSQKCGGWIRNDWENWTLPPQYVPLAEWLGLVEQRQREREPS